MKIVKIKKILASVMAVATLSTAGAITASAREIGEFEDFTVTYSGNEKFTSYLTKAVTDRDGVVNLSNDTGSALITATMKNSNGVYRGGVTLQRGTRETFATLLRMHLLAISIVSGSEKPTIQAVVLSRLRVHGRLMNIDLKGGLKPPFILT